MAELINLNKARKRKVRERAGQQAAANRLRHGRTKEQKRRDAAVTEQARQRLDQLRRDQPPEEG